MIYLDKHKFDKNMDITIFENQKLMQLITYLMEENIDDYSENIILEQIGYIFLNYLISMQDQYKDLESIPIC